MRVACGNYREAQGWMSLCDWIGMDLILKCQSRDFCMNNKPQRFTKTMQFLFAIPHWFTFEFLPEFLVNSSRSGVDDVLLAKADAFLRLQDYLPEVLVSWHEASCEPMESYGPMPQSLLVLVVFTGNLCVFFHEGSSMHQLVTRTRSLENRPFSWPSARWEAPSNEHAYAMMCHAWSKSRRCAQCCLKPWRPRPLCFQTFYTALSLSLYAEIFTGIRTYIYLIDFDRISPVPIALMHIFSYTTARWSGLPPFNQYCFEIRFSQKGIPPKKVWFVIFTHQK